MLVKLWTLVAFLALVVVALGLGGVLDGEQCVKVLLGLVAFIQGAKEALREARNDKEGSDAQKK